jgi:proline iminopeptidase
MIPTKRGNIFCKKIYQASYEHNDPMILLHGGPAVPHDYLLPLAKAVKETPVILYDQIGCGASDKPELCDEFWSMRYFVDELKEVIKFFNVKEFHLYGHSWGAAICLAYVLGQSNVDCVNSLVLASPLISIPRWRDDSFELVNAMSDSSKKIFTELEEKKIFSGEEYAKASKEFVTRYLCRVDPWPECLIEALKKSGTESRYKIWGDQGPRYPNGLHKDLDFSERLKELSVPVLMTTGRFDSARPETILAYSKKIPKVEVHILENASHMPHLEEPARYDKILSDFINRNSKVPTFVPSSKL